MNQHVILIGAGGHARVIADIVRASGDTVLGFLDDNKELDTLGTTQDYKRYADAGVQFVLAIGSAEARQTLSRLECTWYIAIHPTAVISPQARIGAGSVVMANAVVNAGASVGKHCIVNTSAVIEHDNVLEDYVHVSVGAKLGGTVHIGSRSWIGIGATVRNNVNICGDCMVGAGAVVVRDIAEPGVYYGVPALKKDIKK